MPFPTNASLPESVRDALPTEAQTIFRNAFNGAFEESGDEESAFKIAWGAVKNAGWRKTDDGEWVKANKMSGKVSFKKRRIPIEKIDEERRLVFGWFSVIEKNGALIVDDIDDDFILPDDLEKAVYDFNLHARAADEKHDAVTKGHLVESIVFTKQKKEILGIEFSDHRVGWWGGFYVQDDAVWKEVKESRYISFSIGGTGHRTPVDKLPEVA